MKVIVTIEVDVADNSERTLSEMNYITDWLEACARKGFGEREGVEIYSEIKG